MYKTYKSMGRIEQLRYGGREYIGKKIIFTVKRDGQNVPLYKNANSDMINIGSHHMNVASTDIQHKVKECKEYPKYVEMLEESPHWIIYVEHMMAGRGPVKIEMPREIPTLILIDIYDTVQERYLSYNFVYQQAHKFRVPIVELYTEFECESLDELYEERDKALEWCKVHKKEGMVIKDYYSKHQTFVKEKIDLPKPKKTKRKVDTSPQLPPMPLEKIRSAVDQALAEVTRNGGDIKSPKDSMPIVAKYVATEAREHCFSPPGSMFQYYQDHLRELNKDE